MKLARHALPRFVLIGIAESRMIVTAWALLHERGIEPAAVREQVRQHLPAVVLASILKGTLVLLGLMLLVVPAVWLRLVLFAVPTVTILERRGPWSSLQRSRMLARGRKGRLLATIGLFEIGMLGLTIGLAVLYSGREVPLWAEVLNQAIGLLLLLPIRATLMTVVYAETRVRLEGYDLEVAADQLSGAGAA